MSEPDSTAGNLYLIEAYAAPHNGRTRRRYAHGRDERDAAASFHVRHPTWLIRDMWRFVPPHAYADPQRDDQEGAG
ncbi:MAG TPA: hypothetical protein VHH34_09450 [Pseudonocardiaceae bacterium]|nr:hypothetical protein [Pseudonocardiaceae bacterium]